MNLLSIIKTYCHIKQVSLFSYLLLSNDIDDTVLISIDLGCLPVLPDVLIGGIACSTNLPEDSCTNCPVLSLDLLFSRYLRLVA